MNIQIYNTNILQIIIQIYEHVYGLSPAIIGKVFKISKTLPYNLRTQ